MSTHTDPAPYSADESPELRLGRNYFEMMRTLGENFASAAGRAEKGELDMTEYDKRNPVCWHLAQAIYHLRKEWSENPQD